ncbi:MAG: hypothetical protein IRY94_02855 [Rhodospirillaceae bacterium]|nr:hypothetical protein [Rhodospirillaceae bacterium]
MSPARFGAALRRWVVAIGALAAVTPALAAGPVDTDWPCEQRKVLEISPGQVWSGPPLDEATAHWEDDAEVAALARRIAARRTSLDEAKTMIDQFSASAGADRNRRLASLAAGMLAIINHDRGSVMAGIERYARRQRALADKIEAQRQELAALPPDDGTPEQQQRRADLQEMQTWDTRIFQERARSLTYVCELPRQLEQRAFALGRAIASHLDR